jgi:arylsulfatase A-like enzyme/Flp pilus assembly protein TadD
VRRPLLILLAVAFGAAAVWLMRRPVPPPAQAPDAGQNVLLITIDTLRADAVGAYGNARAATPWIDRLAAGGLRFDRAHAHTVLTLPSHANILSGLYPQDHGVRDNAGFRFPAGSATLATALKERGYATAAFISAFPLDSRFGLARGFDVYDDGFLDATPHTPLLEQERRGTETVARARRWLDAHAAGRTFCWVHLYEPHAPYTAPEPFNSRFPNDPYGAEVAAADGALEPLLRPILESGPRGRTFVVLTADHGESLGEHGEATHGVFAYESTLRVPLVLYAPALLRPGVVAEEARHIDVLPTVLDAIGVPPPADLRGRSLLPAGAGREAGSPAATYFESLAPNLNRGWAPLRGVIRKDLKYIDLPIPELYDLRADPREAQNLAATRTAEARELHDLLETASTGRGRGSRGSRGSRGLRGLRGSREEGTADGSRVAETAEARERLRSLGYASASVPSRARYTENDDPKHLIGLDARLQEAVRLYTSGNMPGALALAQALVRERPDMRVAWMTLAQIQREAGTLDAAIGSLRRAHDLSPRDTETTALLGAYLTERGAAAEAVAVMTPDASADGADLQLLVALALAQARTGRYADAVATLERARAADPSSAMLFVDLGTVRLMANHADEARRDFEAAIAANPDLARAHSSLAAVNAEAGRTHDAIAGWREATRLDPAEYNRIFALGMSLARAGRNGPAAACLGFFAETAPPRLYGKEIAAARAWLAARH